MLNLEEKTTVKMPPYQEPESEDLFRRPLVTHKWSLGPNLETIQEVLGGTSKVYVDLDWSD